MQQSYSPYSHYRVGAALLSRDGRVFTGCNIENAAYSPTVCAERCAFFKAVSAGVRDFEAIAVVGSREGGEPTGAPPCGVCRQVMAEFCDADSFKIYLMGKSGEIVCHTLGELLPSGFGKGNLG